MGEHPHNHKITCTLPQHQFSRHPPQNVHTFTRNTPPSVDSEENEKRPLDLIQRLEKKLAEYNASQNVFKRWLFEMVSWVVSASCMGAIIGIYISISGEEMTKSEQFLTMANILGKVASAALIVPTSEALGQLKWHWFHESKAMWDFEIFDKASRGAWGAALLLFRTKGRSLAALGALLIVLLLAIDTFFQQVVTYPDHWAMQNSSASIPVVKQYRPPQLKLYLKGQELLTYDELTAATVKKYFYGNGTRSTQLGRGIRPEIPLSCPTSNCIFPEYDTLATCSSCAEVSRSLNITHACLNTTIDWSANYQGPIDSVPYPNGTVCGYFLNITSSTPLLLSGYVVQENGTTNTTGEALLMRTVPLSDFWTRDPYYGSGSVAFKDIRYPIYDGLISSAANGLDSVFQHEPPVVHECVLSWCVQRMRSSYESGIYSESILSTHLNLATGPAPWPWIVTKMEAGTDFVYALNVTLEVPSQSLPGSTLPGPNVTYSVWNETISNVNAIWDDFFPASYTTNDSATQPVLRFQNYEAGPYTRILEFNPWLAPNNVTHHMERLATDMTNMIRSNANSNEMIAGKAYSMEKFVHINWLWLIFPLLLLLLSLVFLVATIVKTSKDTETGIWKTSAMPALIYSLPKETQNKLSPESKWNDAHESSRKVRIKLQPNRGWRVSGISHVSTSPQLPRPAVQAPRGWI
ncbi:uncharacterized protein J4E84_010569 [Alternaria hordeiaustralica]|uniref:uncharacterized protein n=1 Tax=Alternaria hordeiaustralica TaxID=1187925 RepID=UPI0020C3B957|nr:uncharacterized protein J4E84_010569 [Alternaria hordeiaustralica]KAI4674331.1 hypothetical protein J4E84_010569 [Alternaria hordeiaustralica]